MKAAIKALLCESLAVLALASPAFAAIEINYNNGTTLGGGDAVASGDETSNKQILSIVADLLTDDANPFLVSKYKQDVGQLGDTGLFASSYETEFTGADPNGAIITFEGGESTSDGAHLIVKDGNNSPAWYLFDLSDWDGTSTTTLSGFWEGTQGGISHIDLVCAHGDVPPNGVVPEPASVAIWGAIGMLGVGAWRRRRSTNK